MDVKEVIAVLKYCGDPTNGCIDCPISGTAMCRGTAMTEAARMLEEHLDVFCEKKDISKSGLILHLERLEGEFAVLSKTLGHGDVVCEWSCKDDYENLLRVAAWYEGYNEAARKVLHLSEC